MARRYTAVNGAGGVAIVASPGRTALCICGVSTERAVIYYIEAGFDTPADNAEEVIVGRITAIGSGGTTITPDPIDNQEIAANCVVTRDTVTTEPTYTAAKSAFDIFQNQRSPRIWQTIPEYGLKTPATAVNGYGIRAFHSAATPKFQATAHFEE